MTNAHILDSHNNSESDDDLSNIPIHKKGKEVANEAKSENVGEEEEGKRDVYAEKPDSNPMVSHSRNIVQNSTEEANPKSVSSEQERDMADSILNVA